MTVSEYNLGKVGLTPRGAYDEDVTYDRLDVVEHEGSSYVSLVDDNTEPVSDGEAWGLLALRGDDGKGWTGGSYDGETGRVTFTSTDGLGFVTGDLRGLDGDTGPGVASGGSDGQVLAKDGLTDYATKWIDPPEGGGAQVWTTTTAPTTSGGNSTFLIANLTGLPNAEPKVGDIIFYQYGGYQINTVGETAVQTASTQAVGLPSYSNDKAGHCLTAFDYGLEWWPQPITVSGITTTGFEYFLSNFVLPVIQELKMLPDTGCLHYMEWIGIGQNSYPSPVILSYKVNQDSYNGVRGVIYNHPILGSRFYHEYEGHITYTPLPSLIKAGGAILEDDGDYFTELHVEGALQEVGALLDGLETALEEL